MGLLNILQKLGICRFGVTKASYKDAKNRPIELQESGVFNSKKDLINKNNKNNKKII